ncbi:MAG TPA: hypothetical protein VMS74_10780 [Acidimicrobiia bacterium]|nr:hypothetical protein [Acidimicrobiia bacterium]
MDTARVESRLAELFSHPRWIIVNSVSANTQTLIDQLQKWGGSEFLVVAGESGVGDQPHAETVWMPSPPGTVMEGFRRFAERMEDPPPEVRKAVEEFDPHGDARVLGPFFGTPNRFLGRHLYGTRPTAWESLEDKIVSLSIWDAAGLAHRPYEVVDLEEAPRAAARMAGRLGTVWAADNTEGWHGGGEYTRWVPDAAVAHDAVDFLRGRARRVRVMPFLEGIPCSIHGVVTPGGVAALRPVELLILRRRDRTGFLYAGVANTWDPPAALREEMRRAARVVGEVIRDRSGHRGPFSIDGVATRDGFRPTELNPRFSVGYGIQAATIPRLHGGFFVRALVEGDLDLDARELEVALTAAADAQRAVRMGVPVDGAHPRSSMKCQIVDGTVRRSEDGSLLEVGPSPSGSFMLWSVDATDVPAGVSFAPYAAAVLDLAREEWALPIPAVEPAQTDRV